MDHGPSMEGGDENVAKLRAVIKEVVDRNRELAGLLDKAAEEAASGQARLDEILRELERVNRERSASAAALNRSTVVVKEKKLVASKAEADLFDRTAVAVGDLKVECRRVAARLRFREARVVEIGSEIRAHEDLDKAESLAQGLAAAQERARTVDERIAEIAAESGMEPQQLLSGNDVVRKELTVILQHNKRLKAMAGRLSSEKASLGQRLTRLQQGRRAVANRNRAKKQRLRRLLACLAK